MAPSKTLPFKFRKCNQLCFLTPEGRAKLVTLEESLQRVHALQRGSLGGIKTLEARLRADLAGFGTSSR